MIENGYFKQSDSHVEELAGYQLPSDWWSRPWEYAWALEYAEEGQVVADMGCGWMYRPFKDALVDLGCQVYAVDGDNRLLTQEKRTGPGGRAGGALEFVVADITKPIPKIPSGSLDRVFCISVLEDIGDKVPLALQEFSRCLKPGGLCVLTFDTPYLHAPTPVYPGLPIPKFEQAMKDARLRYDGNVNYRTPDFDLVNHQEWNLCVFHCILKKK